jgi:proline dehydrogenase
MKRILRDAWQRLAAHAAKSYVAGPQLSDALGVARRAAKKGIGSTICFWNVKGDDPHAVADAYTAALKQLKEEALDAYLSVKAPALGFSKDLIARLGQAAGSAGMELHFDSLEPEHADQTFSLLVNLSPRPGCTLPGRWQRSIADTDLAVKHALNVRVVKGEWVDPQHPDIDPALGFLRVVDRLVGSARKVAVATHRPELAREALGRLRASGTPCELELLYGLPLRGAMQVAREMDVPVRLYIPYGRAWLPYCMTQLRQKPHLLWWLARDACFARAKHLS